MPETFHPRTLTVLLGLLTGDQAKELDAHAGRAPDPRDRDDCIRYCARATEWFISTFPGLERIPKAEPRTMTR